MGERERALADIVGAGRGVAPAVPTVTALVASGLGEAISSCYERLGGVLAGPPERPGSWDIVADGFVLELDEQRHFNRYRAITFGLAPYEHSGALTERYGAYCREREAECLGSAGWGGYWTNASAEQQFGPADPPRTFGRFGSPRWKQRAYYDTMKDLAAMAGLLRLSRVAVWDRVDVSGGTALLGELLDEWPQPHERLRSSLRLAVMQHVRQSLLTASSR